MEEIRNIDENSIKKHTQNEDEEYKTYYVFSM